MMFLGKFCVPCPVHPCPFSSSYFCSCSAAWCFEETALKFSKLKMSCAAAAQAVSPTASTASNADCTDDEAPSQSNMRCPLLEIVFHYSVGSCMAMMRCHRSTAALSQSCHFAVFVNPVARASSDGATSISRKSVQSATAAGMSGVGPIPQGRCGAY